MIRFALLLAVVAVSATTIDAAPVLLEVDDDDNVSAVDLGGLSNLELLKLELALQHRIDELTNEQAGFVEDAVPIELTEADVRRLVRDRRASFPPVIDDDEDDDDDDVAAIAEPAVPLLIVPDEPEEFVLIPEAADLPLPGQDEPQPVLLTASEVDELQYRQRLYKLGEELIQRATNGL